ncbi:hypothetical protein IU470_00810 [Nocardia abscessus]|uniref:Uncharacterized protein n=1 Tax=Nocardia abscessus TaxID=120957 RepID=A0ABS0BZV8_9NOCA|nr:hypothetical protein [Nocardia abscessus]MBF6223669.1 hypothetical protein [Nocardia abscessus]
MESVDQLTALVGNLLDSSRLAVGVVTPRLRLARPRPDGRVFGQSPLRELVGEVPARSGVRSPAARCP